MHDVRSRHFLEAAAGPAAARQVIGVEQQADVGPKILM
jgi:hypothetical protein